MKQTVKIGENRVTFSQSSKGFWYCSELSIFCTSVIDGIRLMEVAVSEVEKTLKKINNEDK